MIEKFSKLGLLEEKSINAYIEKQIIIDQKINQIFEKCNHIGITTNRDRVFYRNWIKWGFNDGIIQFVANNIKENVFPMQTINRKLAILNQKNIKTIEEAKPYIENNINKKEEFKKT